ncbi:MAG: hypothetical protein AAF633_05455 [Chloroflexota bacterium]
MIETILSFLNDVLQSAIVIFGASIVLYNLPYTLRDRVSRAFSLLISFVVIVYTAELVVSNGVTNLSAEIWLRVGWIGIAQVPAAMLHLSDILLDSTGERSSRRRYIVYATYLAGLIWMTLALLTDTVVGPLVDQGGWSYLSAGPLFWVFTLYMVFICGMALWNLWRARQRALIPTTRRRLTYMLVGGLAAPLAVYPYLLATNNTNVGNTPIAAFILFVGNCIVGLMFGILTSQLVHFATSSSPERVVRVRLYKYMARVPLAATLVLTAYIFSTRSSSFLGLPADLAGAFAVVATVIVVEWAIHVYKRPLERIFQLDNEPDIKRIQLLSERIVTPKELQDFLDSVLATTCNAMQTPTAFIVSYTGTGSQLEASLGLENSSIQNLPQNGELEALMQSGYPLDMATALGDYPIATEEEMLRWEDFWIIPLRNRDESELLGLFGIKARPEAPYFTEVENRLLSRFTRQAALALEDRVLQQQVFAAVEGLLPQITEFQQRHSLASKSNPTPALTEPSESLLTLADGDLNLLVKDALKDYWGGPKLTESPLLNLNVVQQALTDNEGNPTRALRDILNQAIEQQRPEGDRSWTSTDWILYNILELKFLKGYKVRDIARRIAISESDLYRKQKIAIENVANTISIMEKEIPNSLLTEE